MNPNTGGVRMTDNELIALAAKAADVPIYASDDGTLQRRPVWVVKCGGGQCTMPYEQEWNPLRDDAEAFRLAVKLGLGVQWCSTLGYARALHPLERWHTVRVDEYGDDPCATTRRAITRAAAELGKNMP